VSKEEEEKEEERFQAISYEWEQKEGGYSKQKQ
jgi:hypothetical protein